LLEPKNRSASVSIPSYETILTLNSSPRTSGRGSAEVPKGIERFKRAAGEQAVGDGVVLFNGEQSHTVQGVRVVNPLRETGWLVC